MRKKGFTLVELLAVIVILVVILAIALPSISSVIDSAKGGAYESDVKALTKAAKNYIAVDDTKVPVNVGDVSIIKLSDLQTSNFISTIKDFEDSSTECTGYVQVERISSSQLEYNPALKCGDNYQTEGYVEQSLSSVEVLVVAGGGSGGGQGDNDGSGGGGAGGLIFNSSFAVSQGLAINVTVGTGGASVPAHTLGNNGQNSIFGTLVAIGGGGGGCEWSGTRNGKAGGSGGGAGGYSTAWVGGAGTVGQGNKGGDNIMTTESNKGGGGGGGAGGEGIGGGFGVANHESGGVGLYFGDKFGDTFGDNGFFAGGGGDGGGYSGYGGNGGSGGGGGGGSSAAGLANGTSGMSNTGGGGGGAGGKNVGGIGNSGSGGSGIVIVRYPGIQQANGGTVTQVNGYTIHTFTSGTSAFTPLSF